MITLTIPADQARLMAGVWERSQKLFDEGYEAKVISDTAVQVTNPKQTVYTIDIKESTCCCPFFTGRDGKLPCKHLLGWQKLLEDQAEAKGDLLGISGSEGKFPLGRLLMTSGVQEASLRHPDGPICLLPLLLRHSLGDWGEVDEEDRRANDRSLKDGARLLSAYNLADGTKVWIITEADRSATTLLLPEEY